MCRAVSVEVVGCGSSRLRVVIRRRLRMRDDILIIIVRWGGCCVVLSNIN